MNNLKMIISVPVILIISIITGCSDNITSPGEIFNSSDKAVTIEVAKQTDRPLFHAQIRLKPDRSYTLNIENTGLSSFTSCDIKNISAQTGAEDTSDPCRSLLIYSGSSSADKKVNALSCHEEKLDLKEITIKNTSTSFIDAEVILFGTKPSSNIKK